MEMFVSNARRETSRHLHLTMSSHAEAAQNHSLPCAQKKATSTISRRGKSTANNFAKRWLSHPTEAEVTQVEGMTSSRSRRSFSLCCYWIVGAWSSPRPCSEFCGGAHC